MSGPRGLARLGLSSAVAMAGMGSGGLAPEALERVPRRLVTWRLQLAGFPRAGGRMNPSFIYMSK